MGGHQRRELYIPAQMNVGTDIRRAQYNAKLPTTAAQQRNRLGAWSGVSCRPQAEHARGDRISTRKRRLVGKGRAATAQPRR